MTSARDQSAVPAPLHDAEGPSGWLIPSMGHLGQPRRAASRRTQERVGPRPESRPVGPARGRPGPAGGGAGAEPGRPQHPPHSPVPGRVRPVGVRAGGCAAGAVASAV